MAGRGWASPGKCTPKCCPTEILQWVVEGPQPLSGMGDRNLATEEILHKDKDQEQYIQEKFYWHNIIHINTYIFIY